MTGDSTAKPDGMVSEGKSPHSGFTRDLIDADGQRRDRSLTK